MANQLKHVGRMKQSGRKVLVAFRTLPGDAYNCLVIPTESLDDSYHNALINLVESAAAQEANELAEALDRTQFPDGSRMLPSLHAKGKLIKVATGEVEMLPTIGTSILLSELNQIIAEQRGVAIDDLAVKDGLGNSKAEIKEVATATELKTSPAEEPAVINVDPVSFDTVEDEAKYYRSQADKLSKEAASFRRKAEELVPTKKSK
jgi:hypothetical protein